VLLVVLSEQNERVLRLSHVECPNCCASILFRRVSIPHIDEMGFESYAFDCNSCRACLDGIIDPCDGTLLLSITAGRVDGNATPTKWRRVLPLAGLALAAIVNVLWVGVLGYALFELL
jgi:hypothetical protein